MSGRGPGDVSRGAAHSDDGSSILADPNLLPLLLLLFFFSKCSCTPKQIGTSHEIRNKLSQIRVSFS